MHTLNLHEKKKQFFAVISDQNVSQWILVLNLPNCFEIKVEM